ncbi:DUF3987 domain-containing protein [Corallibacter sp.]|uniref:DUF3987 domain-containing protein n=1 Tax=Corallibacter sp. TaxID=2038084 RepID=UPI003AB8CB68
MTKTDKDKAHDKLHAIINKLPEEYRGLIESSYNFKRIPKEYLLSSILFTIGTATGTTFHIKALGYQNYGNLYYTIIGSRGDAKTEAIKTATKPLKIIDDNNYKDFTRELEVSYNEDEKPNRKQILVQNASIEAANKIHYDNPSSIGICIDEIYGLINNMGNSNSRDGVAWRNFLLEGYTNGCIDVSRKTTDSFRINQSCPTLVGGLQHQFIPKLIANGNLESGFIDRLLFCVKITNNNKLQKGFVGIETLDSYSSSIVNILNYKIQAEKPDEEIKSFEIQITDEAHNMLFDYVQNLIERKDKAEPIFEEYMSKMQISIHKLCINVFMMFHSSESNFRNQPLTIENVELAIELNEFYFLNFKIAIDEYYKNANSSEPKIEDIIKMAKKNNAKQKDVVAITGYNKGSISRKWKEL